MTENKMNTDPNQLVDHFFRHEYANILSVLTGKFGLSRIDLVEEAVSAAIEQALNSWKNNGPPANPAGWVYRVASNKLLDSLRRDQTHHKTIEQLHLNSESNGQTDTLEDQLLNESVPPDSLLQMMFVCCHPALDRPSQIALTLKIMCGFSVNEIARGLLMESETVKKKIQRAKRRLFDLQVSIELPDLDSMKYRLGVVNEVLYLMFNEGYCTSHGIEPIRDDICEEAVRLCLLLCNHENFATPDSKALLSLMLFHAARLQSRKDTLGNGVLLEDQDRTQWDDRLIKVANNWLIRSVVEKPSRYHLEAVIASKHCAAKRFDQTDWKTIAMFYEKLMNLFPSPIYQLNFAIAVAQCGEFDLAFTQLEVIRNSGELDSYYLFDCVEAYVLEKSGQKLAARDRYLESLKKNIPDHQRLIVEKRLTHLSSNAV